MKSNRYIKLLKNQFESGFTYYFILLLTLIFGIIVGSLMIKAIDEDRIASILKYSNSYFHVLLMGDIDNILLFKYSIWLNSLFIIVIYLMGLLGLGLIMPGFIFIKGCLWGILVGYLIEIYSLRGFFVSIVAVYPPMLIYIPSIITLSALTMTMSFKYKLTSSRRVMKIRRLDLFEYTFFVLFFSLITMLGAVYEGFISPFFYDFLNIII